MISKTRIHIVVLVTSIIMSMMASAATRWNVDSDGNWTDAANWDAGVPDANNQASSWWPTTITVDSEAIASSFWSQGWDPIGSNLKIQTGGVLNVIGDVNINEWSTAGDRYAGLHVNGGVLNASDLNIAARPTSQGSGSLTLSSGAINIQSFYLGKGLDGLEVHGEATVQNGTFTINENMHIGGAVNKGGTGVLNVRGGTVNVTNGNTYVGGWEDLEAGYTNWGSGVINVYGGEINLGGSAINISQSGASDGTINMYGGIVNVSAPVYMDAASDTGGKAEINLYGGEFRTEALMTIENDSEVHVQGGVLYISGGNELSSVSNWVSANLLTWEQGNTNMLTENWEASWTNSWTNNYGYFTNISQSALFADYDDVSAGDTTAWALDLTPTPALAVSDGEVNSHFYDNNGDMLWSTKDNWNNNSVPTAEDSVQHTWYNETLVIASPAEANELYIQHANTATVAVVKNGSLALSNDLRINSGAGRLIIDGGSVSVGTTLGLGYSAEANGQVELNSGTVMINGETAIGGQDASSSGTITINGGTWTQTNNVFHVGSKSSHYGTGTVNMNGGALNLYLDAYESASAIWQPLRIGNNGNGVVNLNGGTISTRNMIIGSSFGTGSGQLNLLGGTIQIDQNWERESDGGAVSVVGNGSIDVQGGMLQWKGDHASFIKTIYVDTDILTFTNGQANMLADASDMEYSVTNGTTTLHIDYDTIRSGYTTVWAYEDAPPAEAPIMSIAYTDSGSLDLTASNLYYVSTYNLQASFSLSDPTWMTMETTNGVSQASWDLPSSQEALFFRIKEQ